ALPTVFQMVWGRPTIAFDFTETHEPLDEVANAKILQGLVYNYPVENRLLLALGVRRSPVDDLAAILTIREDGSNRIVLRDQPILFSPPGERRDATHNPSAFRAAGHLRHSCPKSGWQGFHGLR